MQATRSAGTSTEMTAPAQTKKETSMPISDRASMVENIRHNDSVAKLVKPFIVGTNQMDQQSRAKEAIAPSIWLNRINVCWRMEFSSARPIRWNQEEARQAPSGQCNMTLTIRSPSQSLDRMVTKRKLWESLDNIPNPKCRSYRNDETKFRGNSVDHEEDIVTAQQPGKLLRTIEFADFSSQVAGNPGKAWKLLYQRAYRMKGLR